MRHSEREDQLSLPQRVQVQSGMSSREATGAPLPGGGGGRGITDWGASQAWKQRRQGSASNV
eukprot:10244708-Prorocentrum_lima.AAC.1